MRTHYLGLAVVCAFVSTNPNRTAAAPPELNSSATITLTGTVQSYRHIRFGHPATSVSAFGTIYWIDYRNVDAADLDALVPPTDDVLPLRVVGKLTWQAGPDGNVEPTVVATKISRAAPGTGDAAEMELTGRLWYAKHIDPVTGHGAIAMFAGGHEIMLDMRQVKALTSDLTGPVVVNGEMNQEGRLTVTRVRPAGPN